MKGGKESNNGDKRSNNKYVNNAVGWLIFRTPKLICFTDILCHYSKSNLHTNINFDHKLVNSRHLHFGYYTTEKFL